MSETSTKEILYDKIPQFYCGDITAETYKNQFYRRVLFTGHKLQIVLQCLQVGEDIDTEKHEEMEQTIHVVSGHGMLYLFESSAKMKFGKDLHPGFVATIPRNQLHYVKNASSTRPLLFYTIYTKAEHPLNLIQKNKYDLPAEGYIVLHGSESDMQLDKFASLSDNKLRNVNVICDWFVNNNTNEIYDLLWLTFQDKDFPQEVVEKIDGIIKERNKEK